MKNHEDIIRDNLASNLKLINSEFILISTEHYIPESKTTKSFIDILAKDNNNNYVIIEVKRSNQSSRQAIHEIYKYTEAIKAEYKVKSSEIKAVIISTEWKELYIPFSTFANESKISIEGFQIETDNNLNILKATKIKPCKTNNGRLFSPIHECNLYSNLENLEKGIESHKKIYELKGIFDYVLIILKGAEFNNEKYKKDLEQVMSNLLGIDKSEFVGHFDNMEVYKYMIYSVFQRLTIEEYYEILKRDKTEYKQTKEYIKYCDFKDEDDILATLENNVLGNLKPWFYSDSSEIGYPAKFANKIIDEEKWEITELIRSSSLIKNKLLTDDKIISETKGLSGIGNSVLQDSCSPNHKSKFIELKETINKTLKNNIVWKNNLKLIFDENDFLKYDKLNIEILTTKNILLSIINIVVNENSLEYLPFYSLEVKNEIENEIYLGSFSWNGEKPNFEKFVNKYFNNEPGNIIMMMTWGISEIENESIFEDLGLTYETYKIKNLIDKDFYILKNYKFKKVSELKNGLIDFINSNQEFIDKLVITHNNHFHKAKIEFKK
ncbi:MAG TPA: endonuclease NucS [Flavobacterium sp.]|uniref:endonuclease NucS domain-containing protein n=1 Tax=unclassified Flavobacterium TaxID=196869 RepID=UPI0025BEB041|nr:MULTISPECIES: endonuclease NucS domain-containing protein [unclassified Flavobacterium]HRE78907.1 endonuclease NucS [Flavobacterium sp.]